VTQKYKYDGDDPVDIPSLGLIDVTKGTHVVVDDPERAESMHSSAIWEHIPDPKRSRAAKKAVAKKATAKKAVAEPAPPAVEPAEPVNTETQEG
jgi:hypothetical protein